MGTVVRLEHNKRHHHKRHYFLLKLLPTLRCLPAVLLSCNLAGKLCRLCQLWC